MGQGWFLPSGPIIIGDLESRYQTCQNHFRSENHQNFVSHTNARVRTIDRASLASLWILSGSLMLNILLTCEHGGNDVPEEYQHLFEDARSALDSHRGYDIGILPFAEEMARCLEAPLISSTVSRLLVELNRSLGHHQLLSEFSDKLSEDSKAELLRKYYFPHRQTVAEAVERSLEYGRVYHLTIHSFTPELRGQVRNADITLLYDYRCLAERRLSELWQQEIERRLGVKVRRNYPYRGHTDGLTATLRRGRGENEYLGICVEVNQKHLLDGYPSGWPVEVSKAFLDAAQRFLHG